MKQTKRKSACFAREENCSLSRGATKGWALVASSQRSSGWGLDTLVHDWHRTRSSRAVRMGGLRHPQKRQWSLRMISTWLQRCVYASVKLDDLSQSSVMQAEGYEQTCGRCLYHCTWSRLSKTRQSELNCATLHTVAVPSRHSQTRQNPTELGD